MDMLLNNFAQAGAEHGVEHERSQFMVAALCRSQVPCRLDGARALQAHAAYTTGVLCSSAAHVARTRASRAPRALRSAPRAARIVLDML